MSADSYLDLRIQELVIHDWDIRSGGTGQATLDSEGVTALLPGSQMWYDLCFRPTARLPQPVVPPSGSGSPNRTGLRTRSKFANPYGSDPKGALRTRLYFAKPYGVGSGPNGLANSGALWLTGIGAGNRPARLPVPGPLWMGAARRTSDRRV